MSKNGNNAMESLIILNEILNYKSIQKSMFFSNINSNLSLNQSFHRTIFYILLAFDL